MDYLVQNFSSDNSWNPDLMNAFPTPISLSGGKLKSSHIHKEWERIHTYTHSPALVTFTILCHNIIQGHLNHLDLDIPLNIMQVYYIDDFMSMRTDEPEPARILKVLIKLCAAEGWR